MTHPAIFARPEPRLEQRRTDAGDVSRLRPILLLVLLMSMAATGIELLLLEHTESATQWIPLGLLGAGFLSALAVAVWPHPPALTLFRGIMGLFVIAGVVGLYLHYRGNLEFELEMNPALEGMELFRKTMMGATPTLSPGVMGQLGLLGLLYAYRYPRLRTADDLPEENR
ncbi:MAG: hypothetical protein ACREMA_08225 [Longimicrobiales bacterium]